MDKDLSRYTFDVVISFAENERDIAVSIRLALEAFGVAVYYYPYEQEINLGFNLKKKLSETYELHSLLAIAIFSEEYFSKPFTQVEYCAILKRLEKDSGYLIPVKVDNTELPREVGGMTFYTWDKDPKKLADVILKRLRNITALFLSTNYDSIESKTQKEIADYITRVLKIGSNGFEYHFSLGLHYYFYTLSENHYRKAYEHLSKALDFNPLITETYEYLCKSIIQERPLVKLNHNEAKQVSSLITKALIIEPYSDAFLSLMLKMEEEYYKRHGLKSPFKYTET